ncbi:MAG: DoxX family protein [Nocardiopsaceae bacterium]|nr:DoxX family protein [Nocardiopsaceae bacterium]
MFDFAGRFPRRIHSSWRSVDTAALVMRVVLGICFILHGGQKLFGLFGGPGIGGTAGFFATAGIPVPEASAYVAAILEFFGGIALLVGFLTVALSAALIIDMILAIATVTFSAGFFGGWELNFYLIALLAALLLTGPGAWSADSALGLTRRRSPAPAAVPSQQEGQAEARA